MNHPNPCRSLASLLTAVIVVVTIALHTTPLQAQETKGPAKQRQFATPEDAIKALLEAARANDKAALHEIFGPDVKGMLTGDPVQDSANSTSFHKALAEKCVPELQSDGRVILNIGAENWPFPIPLMKRDGQWFFDTDAGREEIINRHIGGDELHAIGVCRAYVEAQRQYFSQDPDGSGVHEYARKFKSTLGRKNGLYWPVTGSEAASPFGPLVAEAHYEGYRGDLKKAFHGYFFKILTRQGPAAPGGKADYVVNGKLTGGFALVAYPAVWDKSGVMTFIVNQDGKVYQSHLGAKTERIASGMTEYNPDSHWTVVEEQGIPAQ